MSKQLELQKVLQKQHSSIPRLLHSLKKVSKHILSPVKVFILSHILSPVKDFKGFTFSNLSVPAPGHVKLSNTTAN